MSDRYQKALSDQYEMMQRGEYCDFSIVVEGKLYKVHKFVLGTRSSYFSTLFSTQMVETSQNQLELTDIDADVFEKLLKYIYTCEISDIEQDAEQLMINGDKYHMNDLVGLCETALLNTLNVQNAARCLLLGHLLARRELKRRSHEIIMNNLDAVMKTESWENVVSNHLLMTELESILRSKVIDKIAVAGRVESSAEGKMRWSYTYNLHSIGRLHYVQSPMFSSSDNENTKWKFILQILQNKFKLSLVHLGTLVTVPPVFCSYVIMEKTFHSYPKYHTGVIQTTCCFDVQSVCRKSLLTLSIPQNGLDIQVEVTISNTRTDLCSIQPVANTYFLEYLENSSFTDAVVEVKGVTFSVHKIILSAASPVFAELFKTPDEHFKIEDDDLEPELFREMLALIYRSGEAHEITSACLPLLKTVDRFRLNEKMKSQCRVAVMRSLNNENALDTLIHTWNSGDVILHQIILKYICQNVLVMTTLPSWEKLKDHPKLHNDIFRFMATRVWDFVVL